MCMYTLQVKEIFLAQVYFMNVKTAFRVCTDTWHGEKRTHYTQQAS